MDTEKIFTTRNIVIVIMIFLAALCRLIPAPEYRMWNFTPIGAIALFGGAFINNKRYAFLLPICVMLFTDMLLHIEYLLGMTPFKGFHSLMPWVYGSFIMITYIGMFVKKLQSGYSSVVLTMVAPLLSSMLFFIVTNFGVWVQNGNYSGAGFITCYVEAIPFYKGTVLGDVFFTAILFGGFSIIKSRYRTVALS